MELGIPIPTRKFDPARDGDPQLFVENANEDRRHDPQEVRRRRAQARRKRIAEKRQEGKSLRDIAEEEMIGKTQVERDLRASGVPWGGTPENERSLAGKTSGNGTKDESLYQGNHTSENPGPDKPSVEEKITGRDGKTYPAKRKPKRKRSGRQKAKADTEQPPEAPLAQAQSGAGTDKDSESSPTDEVDELCDEAGQPLPPQAYEAFNQLPQIRKFLRLLDGAAKECERIGRLTAGRRMHWSSAQASIRAARKTIHAGRPAYLCPYCDGKKKDCQTCDGHGWVTASTYDQRPEKAEERARKHLDARKR
jgi:hypothetical protein